MKSKKFLCCLLMFCLVCGAMSRFPIKVLAQEISFSSASLSTAVDRFVSLTVTLANSSENVWFSTSNAGVAIVSSYEDGILEIIGRGVGTCVITGHCSSSGAEASCTITVSASLPAPYAQNKENWCWASCCKKVGPHNGSNPFPSGAAILNDSTGVRIGICGRISQTVYTADVGQRTIVTTVFSNDGNNGAVVSEIEVGLRNSSGVALTVGSEFKLQGTCDLYVDALNAELAAGRWVVGNLVIGASLQAHSIVITSYNATTQKYTYWEPWTDSYGTFSQESLEDDAIIVCASVFAQERKLYCFQYAR